MIYFHFVVDRCCRKCNYVYISSTLKQQTKQSLKGR
ncbi:hypothetical protein VPHD527_0319 [Vibrio phage D527]